MKNINEIWKMNKKIIVLGYLLLCGFSIFCQCISSYSYQGAKNAVEIDSISTKIGSVLFFDFVTYDVPDKLTIYTCRDSFSFYTGAYNDEPGSNFFLGYTEIHLYESTWSLKILNGKYPSNFNGGSVYSNGGLRIVYHTQCCKLKWKIQGNRKDFTVFSICIQLIDIGKIPIDTIQTAHCGPYYESLIYDSCGYILHQHIDSSIVIQPFIKNPSCYGKSDGSIEFPGFEKFNMHDLGVGIYILEISNTLCSNTFEIRLRIDSICQLFIPNVFSPNWDGINDVFFISTDIDFPYALYIYSRWGELIHFGKYISNQTGWNPGDKFQDGVYAYRILLNEKIFTGDVTILR